MISFLQSEENIFYGQDKVCWRNQVIQHKHLKKKENYEKNFMEAVDTMRLLLIPMTVMDGLSLPSLSNVSRTSSLANGLFGFGSFGVPSTRVHSPDQRLPADYCVQYATVILNWNNQNIYLLYPQYNLFFIVTLLGCRGQ